MVDACFRTAAVRAAVVVGVVGAAAAGGGAGEAGGAGAGDELACLYQCFNQLASVLKSHSVS